MVSLFKSMDPKTVTFEQAEKLLSMPRTVGEDDGAVITATNGRYGPYLTKTAKDGTRDTRTLQSEEQIFTITLDQAKDLFAQPKYGRRRGRTPKPPLRELGPDPETGKPVVIRSGFYGDYITDGTTNRTLPKQYTPASIPKEEALRLLAEKRAQGPTTRRRTRRTAGRFTRRTGTRRTTARTTATGRRASTRATTRTASAQPVATRTVRRTTRKASARTTTRRTTRTRKSA